MFRRASLRGPYATLCIPAFGEGEGVCRAAMCGSPEEWLRCVDGVRVVIQSGTPGSSWVHAVVQRV